MSIKQISYQNETQCNTNKESNQYNKQLRSTESADKSKPAYLHGKVKYPFVSTF